MKHLNRLVEANKSFELDVEDQATIVGLADSVSEKGVPYFTRSQVVKIKVALVEDKVVTRDEVIFKEAKVYRAGPMYIPTGGWLSLDPKEVIRIFNTIGKPTYIRDGQTVAEAITSAQYFIDRGIDAKGKRITSPDLYMDAAIKKASKR